MRETIFLLHGFASSAKTWDATRHALERSFQVVTPDWPGFGNRADEAPLGSAGAMAQFVIAHADTLGVQRFHVLGYSMSGFVVQELLSAHATRIGRAVLYGAGARVDAARRFEPLQRTLERLQADGVEKTVQRVAGTWFCEGDQAPAYKSCVEAGRKMSLDAAVAAMRAFEQSDYRGQLGAVSQPVLVIMGERDRTFPIGMGVELRDAIPGAQLCVLPGCAHAAHLERPDLFNRVVCEFLMGR